MRGGATDDGTVDFYGWCAPWCFYPEEISGEESGASVADHGEFCEQIVTYVDGRVRDAGETFIRLDLVRPYIHGVYAQEEYKRLARDSLLRFTTFDADDQDGDPLSEFFFSTGDARKLARALGLAADRLDNLR
jgi:hypothetical protein